MTYDSQHTYFNIMRICWIVKYKLHLILKHQLKQSEKSYFQAARRVFQEQTQVSCHPLLSLSSPLVTQLPPPMGICLHSLVHRTQYCLPSDDPQTCQPIRTAVTPCSSFSRYCEPPSFQTQKCQPESAGETRAKGPVLKITIAAVHSPFNPGVWLCGF